MSAHEEAVVGSERSDAEVERGGHREHDERRREAEVLAAHPKHVEVGRGGSRARRGHRAQQQCGLHEQRHHQRVLRARNTHAAHSFLTWGLSIRKGGCWGQRR